jgi:tRNA pseudouridine55 synthase
MPAKTNDQVSGLLNIDKPRGITSHDVVARVRKLAGQRRVGHAGTLDPLATGVLVVALGQATRLIEYIMPARKQYRATVRFGEATDTLDTEGRVVARSDPSGLTEIWLRAALPAFVGEIEQVPPVFSALKQGGKPIYKRARAGQAVAVEPRRVHIYAINWIAWEPPDLTVDVVCSTGTYIRALARDLGEAVDVPAHLAGLVRTASGNWRLVDAVPLAVLEQADQTDPMAWQQYLYPPDQALAHLQKVFLDEETAARVRRGRQVELNVLAGPESLGEEAQLVRAYTAAEEFLAVLTQIEPGDKLWQPVKVFHTG